MFMVEAQKIRGEMASSAPTFCLAQMLWQSKQHITAHAPGGGASRLHNSMQCTP